MGQRCAGCGRRQGARQQHAPPANSITSNTCSSSSMRSSSSSTWGCPCKYRNAAISCMGSSCTGRQSMVVPDWMQDLSRILMATTLPVSRSTPSAPGNHTLAAFTLPIKQSRSVLTSSYDVPAPQGAPEQVGVQAHRQKQVGGSAHLSRCSSASTLATRWQRWRRKCWLEQSSEAARAVCAQLPQPTPWRLPTHPLQVQRRRQTLLVVSRREAAPPWLREAGPLVSGTCAAQSLCQQGVLRTARAPALCKKLGLLREGSRIRTALHDLSRVLGLGKWCLCCCAAPVATVVGDGRGDSDCDGWHTCEPGQVCRFLHCRRTQTLSPLPHSVYHAPLLGASCERGLATPHASRHIPNPPTRTPANYLATHTLPISSTVQGTWPHLRHASLAGQQRGASNPRQPAPRPALRQQAAGAQRPPLPPPPHPCCTGACWLRRCARH